MYQLRHQLHAVRVRVHRQDDEVVQEAHRLGVGAADQLIDRLDQLVRAEHFGRVQAAVDPDDRLAFLRQRARLIVGQPSASASRREISL